MGSIKSWYNSIFIAPTINILLISKMIQEVKRREEFLSIASHELKTPLTTLQLQLQMLSRELSRFDQSKSCEQLKALSEGSLHQVKRLTNLIDELMDLTRIHLGKIEIFPAACNLAEVVSDHVFALRRNAHQYGSALTFRANAPVVGLFDSSRVGQVVTNLVSNAIKYGQGNPIEVSVESNGDSALIEVKDQGPGISPEKQDLIFQRFERANLDHYTPGLGLGLYICKEIVSAHRGNITVQSHVGKGSVFKVELPMQGA